MYTFLVMSLFSFQSPFNLSVCQIISFCSNFRTKQFMRYPEISQQFIRLCPCCIDKNKKYWRKNKHANAITSSWL